MKRLAIFVFVSFGFVVSVAWGKTSTWTGLGADNCWSTAENWSGGVPGSGSGDRAVFPSGMADCVVDVSGTVNYSSLELEDGTGSLTLTGTGSLVVSSSGTRELIVGTGRELVVDGISVSARNYFQRGDVIVRNEGSLLSTDGWSILRWIYDDARLLIEKGDFVTGENSYLYVSNRAEVIVRDGKFENKNGVYFCNDSHYLQTGGSYVAHRPYYTVYRFQDNSTADIYGGTVQWFDSNGENAYMPASEFFKIAPHRGGRLVVPNAHEPAINLGLSTLPFSFSGEVYVTNRTSETSGGLYFESSSEGAIGGIRGGGDLYANCLNFGFYINVKATTTWDLSKVCLGSGGILHNNPGKYDTTVNVNFIDGTSFGAFADWSFFNGPDRLLNVNLSGPVAFDTLNCFGEKDEILSEVKTHTISGSHVKMTDVTDFRATGGGTVDLTPANFPAQLRNLEVEAGTTLKFTDATAYLKAMNLRMGPGATIEINLASNSYVDASATAQIAADAKIVVTDLPETLVEGRRYPIYKAPARVGGTPDAEFPQIVLPDSVPAGWAVARTANCAYLADGNVYPALSSENPVWTGAGADNKYLTAENWISTSDKWTGTPDSGSAVKFYSTSNNLIETVVNVDADQKLGNMEFGNNVGPFVITNKCLRFAYPSSSAGWSKIYYSVLNNGNFPVILENDVGTYSANTLGLQFQSFKQGSVSILGDSLDVIPLQFGGDVRLGGNYTASRIICNPKYSVVAERRSSLMVLPGGRLTVTEQTGDLITPDERDCEFYYAVATNGTMTVGGTDFTFVKPATHFVDGTLAVTCPLVTPVVQTFRGDGTLRIDDARGNADDCLGGIRLEGNLTFVPGAWADKLTLSVKDNVTIAPTADWTYANSTNIVLHSRAKLTFATGGGNVTLASPIVSEGEVAVTGKGRLTLGAAGTSLRKVTCADGAVVGATDELLQAAADENGFADILRVRNLDGSLVFADDLKTRMRYEVETGSTVFSAKRKLGMVLIFR